MIFQIITLFPERYTAYVETGLPARAHTGGLFKLCPVNLREYAEPGRRGRVDDTPYGGGPGMVIQVGPVDRALASLEHRFPVVLLTPRGERLTQDRVRFFAEYGQDLNAEEPRGLTIVCGYYEGVDERVAGHLVDYQISIGDFVLGSGDLAALCLIEAVTRLLPGYMGSEESGVVESNEDGLLEYPQYTRPAEYRGWTVPDVLLEGHHQKIDDWRREQSRRITQLRRNESGQDVRE